MTARNGETGINKEDDCESNTCGSCKRCCTAAKLNNHNKNGSANEFHENLAKANTELIESHGAVSGNGGKIGSKEIGDEEIRSSLRVVKKENWYLSDSNRGQKRGFLWERSGMLLKAIDGEGFGVMVK